MQMLLVMTGGALGSGARFLAGRAFGGWLGPTYPWGTLFVNLSGGVLMGVLAGVLARTGGGESWRLFAGVGLLGGYTTFSSFALDAVTLWQRGQGLAALGYVALSMAGAISGLAFGLALVRAGAAA